GVHRGEVGAVVDLVVGGDAGERRGPVRDGGGRGGRGAGEGVVGRSTAGNGGAADRYHLVAACVLVGERGAGEGFREDGGRDPVVGQGDGRGRGAVVDLVLSRGKDGQDLRCDRGGKRRTRRIREPMGIPVISREDVVGRRRQIGEREGNERVTARETRE